MSRKSGNRFSDKDMRKIKETGRIAIRSNRDALQSGLPVNSEPCIEWPCGVRGMAQPGSAEVLGTSGRRFESCCPDQRGVSRHSEFRAPTMAARIYKPAKTAMQSGTAKTKDWVLDYEPEQPRVVEPLMGWTSSGDMRQQVRLQFETKEEAVA